MQTNPDTHTPTAEEWRILEQINEVLAGSGDLFSGLEQGLPILTSALSGWGASLYMPMIDSHVGPRWYFYNSPHLWDAYDTEDVETPFIAAMLRVAQTGIAEPGDREFEIGAVLPLKVFDKTVGSLAVTGSGVPKWKFATWELFLRPFARLVALYSQHDKNLNGRPGFMEVVSSRNTLRAIFDSLPISIYSINQDYKIVAVNRIRANRAGNGPQGLVGGICYKSLFRRESPCPGCRVLETFQSGEVTTRLARAGSATGTISEYEISSFPINDDNNDTFQAILIETDVTEKHTLEANLVQAEKLAAVGQLAAGVAHEINNPLTAIIANAQLLLREIPAEYEDILDSVKLIETAGTRASQVVRNLLSIARKEKYDLETVDLNETLHQALSLVQHELVGRPIQIYLRLDDPIPPVTASADQLQGVWINLIINAIDALDKDPGLISIDSRFTGSEFVVTIQDNGKGIASEDLPRVFEPFFTTKSPDRGTGLGLSISLRVIRYHGGTIQVESEPGKWTRFTVVLPGSTNRPPEEDL